MAVEPEQARVRPAKKAGTWYTKEKSKLSKEFQLWLADAKLKKPIDGVVKAIICPHAGYMYCGATAAYSYCHVDPSKIKRVFILGPDHCGAAGSGKHRCLLSNATHWATPFGDVEVDTETVAKLYATQAFDFLSMKEDASEHSMELIVPFLSFMFLSHYENNKDTAQPPQEDTDEEKSSGKHTCKKAWNASFKIVPIMVGHCKSSHHKLYGEMLSEYLNDDSTLFVISSDFAHWGHNYGYTPFDKHNYAKDHIHEYIKDLDFMGMQCIQRLDYPGFHKYLNETQNTICGQHPICVLLNAVNAYHGSSSSKNKRSEKAPPFQMRFVNYSQSNKVTNFNEYSVSYAAGILYQTQE